MGGIFQRFATNVSDAVGSPWAFLVAVAAVVAWAALGPVFGYSDTWQLVVNTSTTIVTFWMVFLIQATQNRDTDEIKAAVQEIRAEVRELVRAVPQADNEVIQEAQEEGTEE